MASFALRANSIRPSKQRAAEESMKRAALTTAALAPLLVASGLCLADNLPGSFPGVSLDAKLIGGQEYEPLYGRIAESEKLTGAR